MELHELVNLINAKFKWPAVEFLEMELLDKGGPYCRFRVGHCEYRVTANKDILAVVCDQGQAYAARVSALLSGYTRNDAGELEPAA